MDLIGIASQAQHGKDTVGDHLRAKLNEIRCDNYWQRSAFAKEVKKIFTDSFGKDAYYIEKWKVVPEIPPDLDMTVRQALQMIGDGFRKIKSTIWIDLFFRDKTTPRIVSDVRYVNELKAIKAHGGYTILVVRPEMINDDPNGSEAQMRPFVDFALKQYNAFHSKYMTGDLMPLDLLDNPPPEGWEYVDYVIMNVGTIDDLYQLVDEALVPALLSNFGVSK
jgi:hypothetical protein